MKDLLVDQNLLDQRKNSNRKKTVDLLKTADLMRTFLKGDSISWSYKV